MPSTASWRLTYHVGQIVYVGRMIKDQQWKTPSIEPGKSKQYNESEGIKDPAKNFGK